MDDLLSLAKPVFDAVMAGHGAYAAALALVLLVALARRYGAKRFPFLGTGLGAALLTCAAAGAGALATGLAAGAGPSLAMLVAALGVAVKAGGGFSLLKPLAEWLRGKGPSWLQPVLSALLWVFVKPDEDAKAAGDAAVKAKPAKGIKSVTGKPRDAK